MNNIDEQLLDENQINICWDMLYSNSFVNICKQIITKNLFRNGIELTTIGKKASAFDKQNDQKETMQQYINENWIGMCTQMIEYIMAIGIVPMQIVNLDGNQVPTVIPWKGKTNNLRITIKSENNSQKFIVYGVENNSFVEIKNAFVLSGFGYDPLLNGSIISPLTLCVTPVATIELLRECMLTSEKKRTEPAMITETVENKSTPIEGVDFDHYCNADMLEVSAENTFFRDETNIQQLNRQKQLYVEHLNPAKKENHSNNYF